MDADEFPLKLPCAGLADPQLSALGPVFAGMPIRVRAVWPEVAAIFRGAPGKRWFGGECTARDQEKQDGTETDHCETSAPLWTGSATRVQHLELPGRWRTVLGCSAYPSAILVESTGGKRQDACGCGVGAGEGFWHGWRARVAPLAAAGSKTIPCQRRGLSGVSEAGYRLFLALLQAPQAGTRLKKLFTKSLRNVAGFVVSFQEAKKAERTSCPLSVNCRF